MSKALLHTFIGLGISGGLVSGVAIAGYIARRDVPVRMLAGVLMPTATVVAASVDPLSRVIQGDPAISSSASENLNSSNVGVPNPDVLNVDAPSAETLKASLHAHLTMLRPGTSGYAEALSDASTVLSTLPAEIDNATNGNSPTAALNSTNPKQQLQNAYDTSSQLFKRHDGGPDAGAMPAPPPPTPPPGGGAAAAPPGPAAPIPHSPSVPVPAEVQDRRANLVPFSLAIATDVATEEGGQGDDWSGDYWADGHAV